jgi:hypothetical protein
VTVALWLLALQGAIGAFDTLQSGVTSALRFLAVVGAVSLSYTTKR